jgi:hypothetical protein
VKAQYNQSQKKYLEFLGEDFAKQNPPFFLFLGKYIHKFKIQFLGEE